jgi:catechol 2,3-dioxygenase-like lactoylglutathione lyase family enzyme
METSQRFDVGGVLLARPFKIRRLGHFGFNVVRMDESLRFYRDLLGFRVSDVRDDAKRVPAGKRADLGDTHGYFMRYGGDHHAFVLYNKRVRDLLDETRRNAAGVTINQITWQVGSLSEVVNGHHWFVKQGRRIRRAGRDMPGSNWHTYLFDPDGHVNEIYYGIEQVGWSGFSKPAAMHAREFREVAPLPQVSEADEVEEALAHGVDLASGHRDRDPPGPRFDVDGVLLPQPFKVVRLGPVSLFVNDMDAALAFYRDTLGFTVSEEAQWQGERCVFLRANTEHHSLALYPLALRGRLGLSGHTSCMALGLQLANYRQLRDAVRFLREAGMRVIEIPGELHPGIEYAAHVLDPDGHALQLYHQMEQVGWDGRTRPRTNAARPFAEWPETIPESTDTYMGEPYLGPWR